MKNTIAKILGVVLTAVTVLSLFAFALPVGAATITPQTWTKQALPGATGWVMPPNDITSAAFTDTTTGPMAQDSAGNLYVAVQTNQTASPYYILKSINGGRSWAATGASTTAGPVTAIVTFGASSVYFAVGTSVYRSLNGGTDFTMITGTTGTINSIDVATLAGRNLVALGTSTGVFYFDEADPFYTVVPVASNPITAVTYSVAFSPSFATDRGLAALTADGVAHFIVFGGAWDATISATASVGTITAGSIHYVSDWDIVAKPAYYFSCDLGVYAFSGKLSPTASATLPLTTTATLPTSFVLGTVTSLDVFGSSASSTIVAGLGASSTSNVIYSTNGGVSWSAASKLYGPLTGKTYVALDNVAYATSNKVYALVGGTGLTADDQSGFSYSADKGVTFNQTSLINNTVSVINGVAVSGANTIVSTSLTGLSVTSAQTAGSFTITAGTRYTKANSAVVQSTVTIAVTSAETVTVTLLSGGITYGTVTGGSRTNNIITFASAGNVVITPTVATSQFQAVSATAASGFSVSSTTGVNGITTNTAAKDFTAQMNNMAANEVDTAIPTDTVVTGVPVTGVTVSPAAIWTQSTGTITFTNTNTVATITNTGSGDITATALTATYTLNDGNGPATSGVAPVSAVVVNSTLTVPGAWGTSVSTNSFTALKAIKYANPNNDSIFRLNAGNWERVFLANPITLPTAVSTGITTFFPVNTIVGVANILQTTADGSVFIAGLGGITIQVSKDAGQTFKALGSVVGSSNGIPDRIDSMLAISATTVYVGSSVTGSGGGVLTNQTPRVVLTTVGGTGTILVPAWSETPVVKADGLTTLTSGSFVSSIAAAGSDILVAVADSSTFVFKSVTTLGVTAYVGLADPTLGGNDATLPASNSGVRTLVAPGADYPATIFATQNAGGVYRYSSTAAAVTGTLTNNSPAAVTGWLRVDNASYNANGAVGTGSGLVVAAGGPTAGEGSGVIYATDSSAGIVATPTTTAQGVSRIRGLTTQAEAMLGPSQLTLSGNTAFNGLYAESIALGNVKLWTLDNTSNATHVPALYTYIDTLGVVGTGVIVPAATLGSMTATVTFNTLANATSYVGFVNTTLQKNRYSAANADLVIPIAPVISADGKTATFTVTGMLPNTLYNVSVWATSPVSSFMYTNSFTTNPLVPQVATGLTPFPGQQNVMTLPTFQWNPVTGATGYELWLDTKPGDINGLNTATATKYTSATNAFAAPAALANSTVYYWQVRALTTTGYSAWNGTWSFTTVLTVIPPVTVTSNPVPTIILTATSNPVPTIVISNPPVVTVTQAAAAPAITVTQPSYTLVTPTAETPSYIWNLRN